MADRFWVIAPRSCLHEGCSPHTKSERLTSEQRKETATLPRPYLTWTACQGLLPPYATSANLDQPLGRIPQRASGEPHGWVCAGRPLLTLTLHGS